MRALRAPAVHDPETIDAMSAAAARLLDDHPELTAMIAPQQQSAIGVLKVCYTRGIIVPRDLRW